MADTLFTAGGFDRMDSGKVRFLQELAGHGNVYAGLFSDELIKEMTGKIPDFPLEERVYFVKHIRYVHRTLIIDEPGQLDDIRSLCGVDPNRWLALLSDTVTEKAGFAKRASAQDIPYKSLMPKMTETFPEHRFEPPDSAKRKVIVTGSFDWLHTGHIRFFEEAARYGNLYVVVGHDKNIARLKGPSHPLFPEEERRYMAGSVRFVKKALISSGDGWLDAEPEIEHLQPDCYVVNEDGDKEVKREYCRKKGIEYIILKRTPKPGLPPRSSTSLRGF